MPRVTCAECGKSLTRPGRSIAINKSGLYFCNSKEKAAYWSRTGRASEEQKPRVRVEIKLKIGDVVYG